MPKTQKIYGFPTTGKTHFIREIDRKNPHLKIMDTDKLFEALVIDYFKKKFHRRRTEKDSKLADEMKPLIHLAGKTFDNKIHVYITNVWGRPESLGFKFNFGFVRTRTEDVLYIQHKIRKDDDLWDKTMINKWISDVKYTADVCDKVVILQKSQFISDFYDVVVENDEVMVTPVKDYLDKFHVVDNRDDINNMIELAQ